MGIFGKKTDSGDASNVPTARVISLSRQGMTKPQIINTLKNEGFSPMQVDVALKEAMRRTVGSTYQSESAPSPFRGPPTPPQNRPFSPSPEPPTQRQIPHAPIQDYGKLRPPLPPQGMDYLEEGREDLETAIPEESLGPPRRRPLENAPEEEMDMEVDDDFDDDIEAGIPQLPPGFGKPRREESLKARPAEPLEQPRRRSFESEFPEEDMEDDMDMPLFQRAAETRGKKLEDFEEVAEGVVEEKWDEFERELGEMDNNMKHLESRISKIEKTIDEIGEVKKGEVEDIQTKLDGYKGSMDEMVVRMGAIESAVKDSLTPMMQSMRALSDAIRALKSTSPGPSVKPKTTGET